MPLTGDGYFAGEYPGGTTTVEGAPVSATVLVYQRDSGQLIAQTESSQLGEWIVTGVDLSKAHDIVGRKEGFNDVIVSNVMPTSMVDIAYAGAVVENETFTGSIGLIELVGGIPPYAASVVDPLPAGLFPVVDGRQLIIDGTTTDDDVFNSTVRITSSNGATKDVPVKLVVGFKAPANFEAKTLEDAGTFSVVLTWEVTNTTQEVLVFKSATPFDLESMPAPIATLTGDAVSYTDDDVIEDDVFYYMVASVCESYTLYSDGVTEVVTIGDPHWDKVVSLLHFDGDVIDEKGKDWMLYGNTRFIPNPTSVFGSAIDFHNKTVADYISLTPDADFNFGSGDLTVELMVDARDMSPNGATSFLVGSWSEGGKSGTNWYLAAVSRKLVFFANGLLNLTSSVSLPLNMVHVAYTRSGNTHRLFIDGVNVAEASVAGVIPYSSQPIKIGRWDATNGWLDGVIDELRITKGVARYTENFIPPTEPFPNM